MKVLSLTEPWATLVAIGAKRVETRSWNSHYRGLVAIHAASTFPSWAQAFVNQEPFRTALCDEAALLRFASPEFRTARDLASLRLGHIIAVARMVDVKHTGLRGDDPEWVRSLSDNERAFGNYEPRRYGFFLEDVVRLEQPVFCKGQQRLFNPSAAVLFAVQAQLPAGMREVAAPAGQEVLL